MIELKQRGQLICQVCVKKSVKNMFVVIQTTQKKIMGAVHTATFCSHELTPPLLYLKLENYLELDTIVVLDMEN